MEKTVELIDELGIASAKAQELRGPVTTTAKLKYDRNHRVYIMRDIVSISSHPDQGKYLSAGISQKIVAVGLIKVGEKNLYMIV